MDHGLDAVLPQFEAVLPPVEHLHVRPTGIVYAHGGPEITVAMSPSMSTFQNVERDAPRHRRLYRASSE
jgi:hypothetical protein